MRYQNFYHNLHNAKVNKDHLSKPTR